MISRTGAINRLLFPSVIWKMPSEEIFLTFDDGPHPLATPAVLKVLAAQGITATFFLSGEAASKFPSIISDIASAGHSIGVHSFHHTRNAAFSKSKTKTEILSAEKAITDHVQQENKLFRPPYGFFTWNSIAATRELGYRFIMWTNLTGDFREWDIKRIVLNATRDLKGGSILVFHDNHLTMNKISPILQETIQTIRNRGFTFGKIT
jgi:peptidoglycan-N-acetylglucosamine deacetylase